MSHALEKLGATLRELRTAKGLSQRRLSDIAGVPQAHISRIESGSVDLRLSSLLAMAHALDHDFAVVPLGPTTHPSPPALPLNRRNLPAPALLPEGLDYNG